VSRTQSRLALNCAVFSRKFEVENFQAQAGSQSHNQELSQDDRRQCGIFRLRSGHAPACVAKVGICKELEFPTAGYALEIMFHLVRWPLGAEEILQGARALCKTHFAFVHCVE
jgi:hypothetical protein